MSKSLSILIDVAAAAILAAATSFALIAPSVLPPLPAAFAAGTVFVLAFAGLHRLPGEPALQFHFVPVPLEFDPDIELLLDQPLKRAAVAWAGPKPTPGELHAVIERHLREQPAPQLPDAAEELRAALASLRRAIR